MNESAYRSSSSSIRFTEVAGEPAGQKIGSFAAIGSERRQLAASNCRMKLGLSAAAASSARFIYLHALSSIAFRSAWLFLPKHADTLQPFVDNPPFQS
jgi:hypothetical protein